ncbi:WecB/TagA/CpsF family glycosyltransferase [Microlunatus ginsengisoli]|uniref:WecB/TagA/CpsF family glycosyltransferase n=1 Tax=Microlunatus ginsengisoli TaxID=363863 RepID=UPI0031D2A434
MTISDSPHDHLELFERIERPQRQLPLDWPRVQLAGATTDLFDVDDALGLIMDHAENPDGQVLGVVSINLDHVHHFGSGRTTARLERTAVLNLSMTGHARWLALLDGAPLVRRAGELTGRPWPRLAGSDLIEPILDQAEKRGLSVGFLGGAPETHDLLSPVMKKRWPDLRVAGYWAPTRSDLDDPGRASALAAEVKRNAVDVLAVCLGKPRQERWIAEYGAESGAAVCLAFGAVVDFLAGRVDRAPRWIADHGLEWAWRLAAEPRRLARRYLIQGPPAYVALQRDSFAVLPTTYFPDTSTPTKHRFRAVGARRFAEPGTRPDVGVVIVGGLDALGSQIDSLRDELSSQRLSVVVVVGPDDPVDVESDVVVVRTSARRDIGQQINEGRRALGEAQSVLILGAGLLVERGSLRALAQRLLHDDVVGALPRLLDRGGWVEPTLMRAHSPMRTVGDAIFVDGLRNRPGWISGTVWQARSYRYAHPADGANELALMVPWNVDHRVGDWRPGDGLEVVNDYIARATSHGGNVWFEPMATMRRGSNARLLLPPRTRR